MQLSFFFFSYKSVFHPVVSDLLLKVNTILNQFVVLFTYWLVGAEEARSLTLG